MEKTGIHFKTDVFAAVAVVDAKAPYYQFDKTTGDMSLTHLNLTSLGPGYALGGKGEKIGMHKKKVASEASRAEVWEGERLVKGPPPFPSPQATDIFFLLLRFLL